MAGYIWPLIVLYVVGLLWPVPDSKGRFGQDL